MGIRLFVEVLSHAPTTLTHREKLLLAVLAEDARDSTRMTWNSIESPKILKGAELSRSELYAVIKKLITKGVLERVAAGQKNGTAKYRILELAQSQQIPDAEAAAQSPESPDTEASQSQQYPDTDTPPQGQQNPDAEPSQRQQFPDTEPPFQGQQFPDTDDSQCQQIPDVSVGESPTPTPQPLNTDPLKAGVADETTGPAGVSAQTIVAEWLERCASRPPSSVIGQTSKQIKVLLEDDGIDPYDIRRGLALWMTKGLSPAVLPAVVNQVMNAAPQQQASRSQAAYGASSDGGDLFDRAMARAAAREQQMKEQQP